MTHLNIFDIQYIGISVHFLKFALSAVERILEECYFTKNKFHNFKKTIGNCLNRNFFKFFKRSGINSQGNNNSINYNSR